MTDGPDPADYPASAVLMLMGACDRDDPEEARSYLSSDLLNEIDSSDIGWEDWWAETRPRLSTITFDEWDVIQGNSAQHTRWGPGHRIMLAPKADVPKEPGGVTADGEPYDVTSEERPIEGVITFWVTVAPEGWRIRGFGVE